MQLRVWIIAFAASIFLKTGFSLYEFWFNDPVEVVQKSLVTAVEKQKADIESVAAAVLENHSGGIKTNHSYRVYSNGELILWSDNTPVPAYSTIRAIDSIGFDRDTTHLVLKREIDNKGSNVEIYSLSTIRTKYEITNQYLKNSSNRALFKGYNVEIGGSEIINVGPLSIPVEIEAKTVGALDGIIALLVFCTGLGLLFSVFDRLFLSVAIFELQLSFVLLVPVIRAIQLYLLPIELSLDGILFNRLIYSAGWIHPTMADLVLNIGLVLWIIAKLSNLVDQNLVESHINKYLRWLVLTILIFVSIASSLVLYESLLSLSINSQVTVDISKTIAVEVARVYVYIAATMHIFAYLAFNHLVVKIINYLKSAEVELRILLSISVLLGLVIFPISYYWVILVHLLLALFLKINPSSFSITPSSSFYFLLFLSVIGSTISGLSVYRYDEQTELIRKQRFVSNLLIGNDIIGEYHLNNAINAITEESSYRTRFLNPILVNQNLVYSVDQSLSNYLDKYELDLFVYDSIGKPYGFTSEVSLQYWLTEYDRTPFETSYRNIYFIPDLSNGRHRYVCIIRFQDRGKPLGYYVLQLTLKKYVNKSVFPELLVESTPQFDITDYDYAYYNSNGLVYSQGNFPFEAIESGIQTNEYEDRGYHFFIRTLESGDQIFVASKAYSLRAILSNISFFFILTLIPIGLLPFIANNGKPNKSLALKIQWFAGLSFTIPILIISLGILNVLNQSYKSEINKNYEKRANTISEYLVEDVERFISNDLNRVRFAQNLSDVATISQSDIMVYNEKGGLMGSNRDEVFSQNLLSPIINPKAKRRIVEKQFQSVILDESIGTLDFKTVYTGIFSYSDGQLLGILAVPFFDFKNHLNRQQVEVFNNIIALFTIIFIVTLIVGNYSLRTLIDPIRLISERLHSINYVEEFNEPLTYDSEDEIGLLVKEYNGMMEKLSRSREELAKIQKETAWKEIARQVAHEIKNPLTPMKLKIQQLQRDFDNSSREHAVLESLLTQVDALSSTADSFSAFAQMPAPQNAIFSFSDLVTNIISLYKSDDLILTSDVESELLVYADQKIFSQILNNLVLNALQSMDGKEQRLEFALEKKGSKAIFSLRDWGIGIQPELQDKVFVPYFSTKATGSGIGLALAKKGIEQAGGNIWFESEADAGTTFYISLPLS